MVDTSYFKNVQFDNQSAYNWALEIGDRDRMKERITDPEWAYHWAKNIGDKEYMQQFINRY